MEISNTIDEKLFLDYTRRRARQIKDIVRKGILEGIDWSNLKQPFGISLSKTPHSKSHSSANLVKSILLNHLLRTP